MKDLILLIAKNLVDNPDEVTVTETETDKNVTFELRVAQDIWARLSASKAG